MIMVHDPGSGSCRDGHQELSFRKDFTNKDESKKKFKGKCYLSIVRLFDI